MKLTFLYAPTTDFSGSLAFYRDTLGWSEAWREGADTVAFTVPDSGVQVMVSVAVGEPPGPMYRVDDLAKFLADTPELEVRYPPRAIPDGFVAGVVDPGGNLVYLFDQRDAS